MKLSSLTNVIAEGGTLDLNQCEQALDQLLHAEVDAEIKAIFLNTQIAAGLKSRELLGFARYLLPKAVPTPFLKTWNNKPILDCCGAGGGGLNIINVSTGIVFILAAAGVPVVKHGNRGITKKSGSADLIEAMRLKPDLNSNQLTESMEELGWTFIFAPLYHPSFKIISPLRKALAVEGKKTIFNFLGPLLNPVQPRVQMVGVFQKDLLPLYHQTLSELGCERPCVLYGEHSDGTILGEASPDGINLFSDPQIHCPSSPTKHPIRELKVKSAADSAYRLENIIKGTEKGLGREIILLNAGVGFTLSGVTSSVSDGISHASAVVDSGRAWKLLQKSRAWASRQSQ